MWISFEDPFRQLYLADDIALVAGGGIRELVLKVTAGYIHWIDVTIWMFDFNDRYTMLAGTRVAA